MTTLTLITPVADDVLARDISLDNARLLIVAFIAEHDITDDVDAHFTDTDGSVRNFDFFNETWRPVEI